MKKAPSTSAFAYPLPGNGKTFSVREAKSHFSQLVDRAAEGEDITITWHGQARARLTALRPAISVFRVDRAWLRTMPKRRRGTPAEALVRADRDARG